MKHFVKSDLRYNFKAILFIKKAFKNLAVLSLLLALPGLFYMGVFFIFGAEDYRFANQMQKGITDTYQLLVLNKFCLSIEDCKKKDFIFYTPKTKKFGGAKITIYEVQDPYLLNQIAQVFITKFLEDPQMKQLSIQAYAFTIQDKNFVPFHTWFEEPMMDLNLRRDK